MPKKLTLTSEITNSQANYHPESNVWTIELDRLPIGKNQLYYFIADLNITDIKYLPMTTPLIAFDDENIPGITLKPQPDGHLEETDKPSPINTIIINTIPNKDSKVATIGDLYHTSRKIIRIIAENIDDSEKHYLATDKLYTSEALNDIAKDVWSYALARNPQSFDFVIDDIINNFFGTLADPILYPHLKAVNYHAN